jgi:hypothetical protein
MELAQYEGTFLHYGECPLCGESRQPDYVNANDPNLEYVVCCDCKIIWYLHHEDETDKRDETEPWRTYRISDIETFKQFGTIPYDCKNQGGV